MTVLVLKGNFEIKTDSSRQRVPAVFLLILFTLLDSLGKLFPVCLEASLDTATQKHPAEKPSCQIVTVKFSC